jgi:hypothetical protein
MASGLIIQIKTTVPSQIYLLLKSYLSDLHFQVKIENTHSGYHPVQSGVPQGSVLGPFLYLIYTSDIPQSQEIALAIFADDIAILSSHTNTNRASETLQNYLNVLQEWLQLWKIKVNNDKSAQITFTTKSRTCPQITIHNAPIPIQFEVKYLGLHLDQKLTWKAHIQANKMQLTTKARNMNWLIGKNSQLSMANKLLSYKTILKPIWKYGIELWGCSKLLNTKVLQTFQSKILRSVTKAPWFVSNQTLHADLGIPL